MKLFVSHDEIPEYLLFQLPDRYNHEYILVEFLELIVDYNSCRMEEYDKVLDSDVEL